MSGSKHHAALDRRLRSVLALRGLSMSAWARLNGWHPAQVSMAVSGTRPYPQIREAIAVVLGVTREEVDREIDGRAAA